MVEDFLFAGQTNEVEEKQTLGVWKVLIVDDEPEVHAVTKLALGDFVFQDKSIEFISAYSGKEAKAVLEQQDDIAIVLLDVVMETDDAGLEVASYIRNNIKNERIRIILRTGQPGQAPEKQVILNYDINDYKSKTELTAQKLFTVILSGLRSYRDIRSLEKNHEGLKKIITASADIFSVQSMEQFIHGVMEQLTSVLGCGEEEALFATDSFMARCGTKTSSKELVVIAAQGQFSDQIGRGVNELEVVKQSELNNAFSKAISSRAIVYQDDYLIAYCHSSYSTNSLLFVSGLPNEISQSKRDLVELFARNVQIAYENIQARVELESSQTELLERLGSAIEQRPGDCGQHIKRVSYLSRLLAELYGLSDSESQILLKAAPLHDVGKVALTTSLLTKPTELSEEEWQFVKQYPKKGNEILVGSNSEMIQYAAIVAHQHSENWDGTGYPQGLKGKSIHIFARIVKIANVYDSLRSSLAYKEAWSHDEVIEYMRRESGKCFDPKLVDLVIENHMKFDQVYNS